VRVNVCTWEVKIQKSDAKFHHELLKAVMVELDGVQPTSEHYARAVHLFDKASEWKIGNVPTAARDAVHPSPWAMFEGQVLHDMVTYVHRLKRSHDNSTDPVLKAPSNTTGG
jgi:hypothetical protein